MSEKRPEAKHKIDRRLGVNLWGRPKSPLNKREYGPGQHGANKKGNNKKSDYGLQLMAKQKLKGYYANIGERQFRKYYQEAVRLRGDTSQNLIGLLERRLDAVIYRAKFAPTMFAARQLVSHGHITVNGKRVNIPSFLVGEGMVVELKEKSRNLPLVILARESAERELPSFMEVDPAAFKATFTRTPKLDEVPYPVMMEPNLVVEFYSR